MGVFWMPVGRQSSLQLGCLSGLRSCWGWTRFWVHGRRYRLPSVPSAWRRSCCSWRNTSRRCALPGQRWCSWQRRRWRRRRLLRNNCSPVTILGAWPSSWCLGFQWGASPPPASHGSGSGWTPATSATCPPPRRWPHCWSASVSILRRFRVFQPLELHPVRIS